MNKNKALRTMMIVLIVIANIGCDQVSKSIVRRSLHPGEQIEVLNNNFILTKVENSGAFLSMGSTFPETLRQILLLLLPAIVIIISLVVVFTNKGLNRASVIGLSFIIGGGIGNIYDRIVHGSVTDFMHMDFVIFRTGIFNMADVSIMTGIGIMLLFYLKKKNPSKALENIHQQKTNNDDKN